ncbi:MAG: hypothetical protein V1928_05615 [Parcubacteria group bacterium]
MKFFSLIILLVVLICSLSVAANPALAIGGAQQQALTGLSSTAGNAKLVAGDPATTIGKAISLVIAVSSLILLIIVVYGGIQWMTAGGNKEQVGKSKSMIIEGVIGLMICLAAYALTSYVVTQITTVTGG